MSNPRFLRNAVVAISCATWFTAACSGDADSTQTNTSSLITDLCDKLGAAPCGTRAIVEQCLAEFQQYQREAQAEGCQSELNAYLACSGTGPVECRSLDFEEPRPGVAVDCDAQSGIFHECVTGVGPECGIGFGPRPDSVSCGVTCAAFSSMCQGPSQFGPLECVCQTGPHAGKTFQATDCSRGVVTATGHECR